MDRRTWLTGLAMAALSGCLRTRGPAVVAGRKAPAFRLKNQLGGETSLDDLTRSGPAVLVFYRGHW